MLLDSEIVIQLVNETYIMGLGMRLTLWGLGMRLTLWVGNEIITAAQVCGALQEIMYIHFTKECNRMVDADA